MCPAAIFTVSVFNEGAGSRFRSANTYWLFLVPFSLKSSVFNSPFSFSSCNGNAMILYITAANITSNFDRSVINRMLSVVMVGSTKILLSYRVRSSSRARGEIGTMNNISNGILKITSVDPTGQNEVHGIYCLSIFICQNQHPVDCRLWLGLKLECPGITLSYHHIPSNQSNCLP